MEMLTFRNSQFQHLKARPLLCTVTARSYSPLHFSFSAFQFFSVSLPFLRVNNFSSIIVEISLTRFRETVLMPLHTQTNLGNEPLHPPFRPYLLNRIRTFHIARHPRGN